jgi:hypothetical protein
LSDQIVVLKQWNLHFLCFSIGLQEQFAYSSSIEF